MISQEKRVKLKEKLCRGDMKKIATRSQVSYEIVRNFYQNKAVTDSDASKIVEVTCDIIIENKAASNKVSAKVTKALAS